MQFRRRIQLLFCLASYPIATMQSFSQNAMPYLMIFFTPRRCKPSAYFFSSIWASAAAQLFSRLPSSAYFSSMTMPTRSGVAMEISL